MRTIDIDHLWYSKKLSLLHLFFIPLSFLFRFIIFLRRWLYRLNIFKTHHFNIPIIIVGNITVGGTGKTPLVVYLANALKTAGYNPGIITRGVGGTNQQAVLEVNPDTPVNLSGDEATLLVRNSQCPIVVGRDKVRCVDRLKSKYHCNVIISDDGLQHYRLGRDIEIALLDGHRNLGNEYLLPAGPLREPKHRLKKVDFIVTNGDASHDMQLVPIEWVSVLNPNITKPLTYFSGKKVNAVTAIGNPYRFFSELNKLKIFTKFNIFRDHYFFTSKDFNFQNSYPILMTEKDAVKCFTFADERFWYLRVRLNIKSSLFESLLTRLKQGVKK